LHTLEAEIDRLLSAADTEALPRALGPPLAAADMRVDPGDFFVSEHNGIQFSGAGEHLYLRIRKTGQNTRWIAKRLAEFADLPYRSVSYAGLKDRHAVTEQWFSMHLPGRDDPDFAELGLPDVEVINSGRHNRKLRQGQLSYNSFNLRLRNVVNLAPTELTARFERIAALGVPNYFGPQRFGRDRGNLRIILRQPNLRRLGREERAFALSALRAALFNAWLSHRVARGDWCEKLPGDALLSDRPRGAAEGDDSVFQAELLPAGALWGKGFGGSSGATRTEEEAFFADFPEVTTLLERAGARFSRRVLRARLARASCRQHDDSVEFSFALGPGVFATTVLRELFVINDRATFKQDHSDA
jgi:tRNA pseudouridine13 synthase